MAKMFASNAGPAVRWRGSQAGEDYGASAEPNWREVDWPAHLHQVEIGGASVNYVDMGSGEEPPVMLVHGLGGQWQNWLENIPRIARERRVVALDLPGFGLSEMPTEQISIPGYGRCVDALCERLDLGRVSVVGNSMGGFIASEVAIQFPERVDRLVLASAAGISSANVHRAPALTAGRIASAVAAYTAARHESIAKRPGTRHGAMLLVARYPARLKPDLVYEGFMKGAGKPGFDDALRALLGYDFRERLPEISSPTLIVWGDKDSIISVRDAAEFERLIPDSRKVVMEQTGHVPMAERPESFNRLLLDFIEETGPAEDKEAAEGESQPV
jgi:pimeloyl-ACP methyl ester carboxylesterase